MYIVYLQNTYCTPQTTKKMHPINCTPQAVQVQELNEFIFS